MNLETRLAKCVSAKLGDDCQFSHWIKLSTGDIPVFRINPFLWQRANALGLHYDDGFMSKPKA